MMPMISPIAPPTSMELRVLRAVVFVGIGPVDELRLLDVLGLRQQLPVVRLLEQQLSFLLDGCVQVPLQARAARSGVDCLRP